jgi:deoxyribonuclease-1
MLRPVTALLTLLALLPALAIAGGQTRLLDAKDAIQNSFWKELYFAGGEAIWCRTKFVDPGARITADAIYQAPWIKDAVGCTTRDQCEANKDYQRMTADLHNLYPAEKRVQLDRRNILFDKVSNTDPLPEPSCVYKIFGGQMEPNNEIKGDVARAILYMHVEYDLKVPGPINMFIDWNNVDAPSAEEKRRNDMIEKIQGTRNRFIDNYKSAEKFRAR